MKLYQYLLLCLFLSSLACRDNSTGPDESELPIKDLHGQLINWTLGDSIAILAARSLNPYGRGESLFVFGQSMVSPDGNFNINFTTPSVNLLGRSSSSWLTHLKTTDINAKYLEIPRVFLKHGNLLLDSLVAYNASIPDSVFASDSAKVGNFILFSFAYCDREAEFTGADALVSLNYLIEVHNDLHLHKGWNRIIRTIVEISMKQRIEQWTVANAMNGNWYVSHE